MSSVISICNLALSHLGDSATVSSIDPPEGSAQAEHCARFYPIARDSLIQMHHWNFACRRIALALVTNPYTQWTYAYALPSECLAVLEVISPDASDDYSTHVQPSDSPFYPPVVAAGEYVPQPYTIESDSLGNMVLYTNQENALLRYQARVADPEKFDPLFVLALSWHLASMIAGPLLKGDQGAAEGKRCIQMMTAYLAQARMSDSSQRNIRPEHIVPWTSGR